MPRPPAAPSAAGAALWLAAALLLIGAGAALRAADPSLDLWLFEAVNGATGRASFDAPMLWSSLCVLGLGLSAVIVVAAVMRNDPRALACLVWTLPIGTLLTHAPKNLLALPRPAKQLGVEAVRVIGEPVIGSFSMPSGHALTAFTVCALLWFTMPVRQRNRWLPLTLLAAVGVAWSRIAVSAHWPSDVMVGGGLGIVCAWASCEAPRHIDAYGRWTARLAAWLATARGQTTIAGVEVIVAIGMLRQHTGYPLGWSMQWGLAVVALASAGIRLWALRRRSGAATAARPDPLLSAAEGPAATAPPESR